MWKYIAGALTVLLLMPAAWAQEEAKKEAEPPSPARQYAELMSEYSKVRSDVVAEYRQATDDAARLELQKKLEESTSDIAKKCWTSRKVIQRIELRRCRSLDSAVCSAFTCRAASRQGDSRSCQDRPQEFGSDQQPDVVGDANRGRNREGGGPGDYPVDRIQQGRSGNAHAVDDDRHRSWHAQRTVRQSVGNSAGEICQRRPVRPHLLKPGAIKQLCILRQVIEKTTNNKVKGHALYALANSMLNGPEKSQKEAEQLLAKVVADYGDIPSSRGTLGDLAAGPLFELQHLQIGMEAPNIEGEDVDGAKFQLADYRGKVVVIDFWGDW